MLELELARREFTADGETITATPITPTARVIEYIPQDVSYQVWTTHGDRPGSTPTRHTAGNVVETLRLAVACDAPGALRAFAAELERALLWHEQKREDMTPFIRVRDDERYPAGIWFESRLVGGRVELDNSAGRVLRLTLERFPYWEGAWTRLAVKNNRTEELQPEGAEFDYDGWATFGAVTNADDADPLRDNWLMLEPPPGDVPAPLRIRIQNDYATARLATVRTGWYDRQQNLILEGEDGILAGAGTVTVDPEYSNEQYALAQNFRWVVPQELYRDFVGPFRVWANGALEGSTWRFGAGYELTRQQYGTRAAVDGARGWTDLGQIRLPAGGYRTPSRYPAAFWLDGSGNGALDYVVLQPVHQHRRLTFAGYNCLPGACIVDDPEQGPYYEYSGEKIQVLNAWGNPLEAWPEGLLPFQGIETPHYQTLTFMLTSDAGRAEADRSALVEVFARPRYRVLP